MEDHIDVTSLRVASTSERVRLIGEGRTGLDVSGEARVSSDSGRVTIDTVQSPLVIRVPEGIDVVIGTTSARVEVEGSVGNVAIVTESGRVSVESATSVDIRTNNARVEVGRVDDDCRIRTKTGRVSVGSCRDVDAATDSGRIKLAGVTGSVSAHCISGRIEIDLIAANDVKAETVSGRISISLPANTRFFRLDEAWTGTVTPEDYDCTVDARSVSGRVEVSSR